jgi:hypothetical protein
VEAAARDELNMFVRLRGAGEGVTVVEPKAVHLREGPAPSFQIFDGERGALVDKSVGGEDGLWAWREVS